jgi:hypothetical protein
MRNICPELLSTVGETAEGIRVGFIESDTIFIMYLFIYYKKVCTFPINQLPTPRAPSFTQSQISYITNQQSLHSRTINLRVCVGQDDCSVGIATRYVLDGPGIESRWGTISLTRPGRPWDPPSLLYNGYRVFPGGKAARTWR